MELESLLKLIMARREIALQDSDSNLAFLLATCYEELVKYDLKLERAEEYIGWLHAGNYHSRFIKDLIQIDKEITFKKLLEELNEKED